MSVFRSKFIKAARKNHRCAGCDNFVTIAIGQPYYSCFFADRNDACGYGMCVPCWDHVHDCKECMEAWLDGSPHWIYECRQETAKAKMEKQTYRCPDCGYTHKDAMIHMDHSICESKGGPKMPELSAEHREKIACEIYVEQYA